MTRVDRRLVVYPWVALPMIGAVLAIVLGGDEVRKVVTTALIDGGIFVAIAALAGKHGQPIWDGLGKRFSKDKPGEGA